jgi:hypothetical protein
MKIKFLTFIVLIFVALAFVFTVSATGVTKRIKFAAGKHSAVVSGAVIRGDEDTYILGAKEGQVMAVKITSVEKNAVVNIKGPDGEFLQDASDSDDATDVSVDIPQTGDYKIHVGGTRGNASYKLTVSIQ